VEIMMSIPGLTPHSPQNPSWLPLVDLCIPDAQGTRLLTAMNCMESHWQEKIKTVMLLLCDVQGEQRYTYTHS